MATYRQVHISFWQDPFIEDLTPIQRYFYLYLMTNSKTKQCGCYEISMKLIRYETGLDQTVIDQCIDFLCDKNKIRYNENNGEFIILNWLKHNSFRSPKVKSCIEKEVKLIKTFEYSKYILSVLDGNPIDSLSIDYTKSMYTGLQKEEEEEKEENNNIYCASKDAVLIENTKKDEPDPVETLFEQLWKLYPNKKGKASVSKKSKNELSKHGVDVIKKCIDRYDKYVKAQHERGFDLQYQNGSTFFNSGYMDYLDENYTEPKTNTVKLNVPKNKFINYNQRQYNHDELEKKALQRRLNLTKEG